MCSLIEKLNMNDYVPRSRIAAIEEEMQIIENKLVMVQNSAHKEIERLSSVIKLHEKEIKELRREVMLEALRRGN